MGAPAPAGRDELQRHPRRRQSAAADGLKGTAEESEADLAMSW
jgi:hypothetical protein